MLVGETARQIRCQCREQEPGPEFVSVLRKVECPRIVNWQ
jgi:hypothetical protein